MPLTKQLIGLVPLTLILLGLLSYNFMSAQWSAPTATAPGNNATAPINISNNYQAKLGDLGAVRMRAGEYCDAAGLNCRSATSTDGGLGYNQVWQRMNRIQGVWYQNQTGQPIMVLHKNIWDGTNVDIGVSSSSFVALDFRDLDSDLDNGSTFIVPPNHFYRMNTLTGNPTNGHRVYLELR